MLLHPARAVRAAGFTPLAVLSRILLGQGCMTLKSYKHYKFYMTPGIRMPAGDPYLAACRTFDLKTTSTATPRN